MTDPITARRSHEADGAEDWRGEGTAQQDAAESSQFTPRIGRTALGALALDGYTRYDQLTGVTAKDVLKIHGVGPKAIRILEEELAAQGLAFASE